MPETPAALPPFASDNYAGTHPDVLAAVAAANDGFSVAYGDDPWTARLDERTAEVFGPGALAFPLTNGTGANVVSLMALSERWGGVVASDLAHANTDENGAPERVGGLKILPCPSTDGRITPDDVARWAGQRHDVHRAHPGVLTLTQSTELGTVYSVDATRALVEAAHGLGMAVHVDGSRLANAAASLDCSLGALTRDLGVDVLSFGAAKNGGMIGEAVVVLAPEDAPQVPGSGYDGAARRRAAADAVPYLRKATMQLVSKTRYVSAQLLALLGEPGEPVDAADGSAAPLWHRNAAHANAMARRLRDGLGAADVLDVTPGPAGTEPDELVVPQGIRVTRPVEANAVFATLPREAADRLRERSRFYDWAAGETPDRVEVRWMCSWDTPADAVDTFVAAVAAELS
ncbi:low specificity L-threonine aldolase [Isoptericola sp. b408]|uniref:threonine aldolase family protein n=1 Tax=Isoptericola sp. b408 TaxID=3064653 RepID=UPI0027123DB1|nr:beta-eliminating lyase-related protein [Isoptericola sp. b408]MDO8150161.1 beta-eliminating lyase-related protein [Isoptericola sp. b408]